MYLSKLVLDPRSPAYLRDAGDVHEMHRTVMSAYPGAGPAPARRAHGVLWRIDRAEGHPPVQYVQSHAPADWSRLPPGLLARPPLTRPLRPVLDAVTEGRRYGFRLLANPTRCVHPDGAPGVRKRVGLADDGECAAWLERKGAQHGFAVAGAALTATATLVGRRRQRRRITLRAVRFDGHLVVTDPAAFVAAVTDGVGRARAYGCGLLSLTPPLSVIQ